MPGAVTAGAGRRRKSCEVTGVTPLPISLDNASALAYYVGMVREGQTMAKQDIQNAWELATLDEMSAIHRRREACQCGGGLSGEACSECHAGARRLAEVQAEWNLRHTAKAFDRGVCEGI